MKPIISKARKVNDGAWIEGYSFYNPNIDKTFTHNWLYGGLIEVEPNSICYDTGLQIDGEKIFENDILMNNEAKILYVVYWSEDELTYLVDEYSKNDIEADLSGGSINLCNLDLTKLRIVGNTVTDKIEDIFFGRFGAKDEPSKKIKCHCGTSIHEFDTKEQAISFFEHCSYCCDPASSEHSRYAKLVTDIKFSSENKVEFFDE